MDMVQSQAAKEAEVVAVLRDILDRFGRGERFAGIDRMADHSVNYIDMGEIQITVSKKGHIELLEWMKPSTAGFAEHDHVHVHNVVVEGVRAEIDIEFTSFSGLRLRSLYVLEKFNGAWFSTSYRARLLAPT